MNETEARLLADVYEILRNDVRMWTRGLGEHRIEILDIGDILS